jgi:hypothetical protein
MLIDLIKIFANYFSLITDFFAENSNIVEKIILFYYVKLLFFPLIS